jgi:hypothetical protein
MTYRQKIQQMVEKINILYVEAEWLRDLATGEEKEYWNKHRKIFYEADIPLRKLDDSLSDVRAKMCLHNYEETMREKVKCKNCNEWFVINEQTCIDCKKTRTRLECDNCGATWPTIID